METPGGVPPPNFSAVGMRGRVRDGDIDVKRYIDRDRDRDKDRD